MLHKQPPHPPDEHPYKKLKLSYGNYNYLISGVVGGFRVKENYEL